MGKKLLNLLKDQYEGNVLDEDEFEEEEFNEFDEFVDDPGFIGRYKNQ